MTQSIVDLVRELDDLTAVRLLRHVGPMLFKDPQIRQLVRTFPPSAAPLAALANLSDSQKQETLTSDRSIWLARALLAALASEPRFREVLAQALDSLRRDELVAEARVHRELATDILRILASAREAQGTGAGQRREAAVRGEFVPDSLVHLAQVALAPEGAPAPAPEAQRELASPPDLCLNAWFPDQPDDVARLIVGVGTRLCVNLGPPRAGAAGSEALPGELVRELCEVPFVDVLLLCAGADIEPLRQRLPMPPDAERVLKFTLIARHPGELEIQIVVLVHNEPIHRMRFPVMAINLSDMAVTATGGQI